MKGVTNLIGTLGKKDLRSAYMGIRKNAPSSSYWSSADKKKIVSLYEKK